MASSQQARLLRFLELLGKWNGVYNLTAVRDPRDMLVVHLLDSLSVLALIDELRPEILVDVGSGAGLPAIPLAITRPEMEIHSIDAVNKKIGFQLQAKADLGLQQLHPLHVRIENFLLPHPPSAIVSRAYSELAKMLDSIDHLADASTTVIAMKGVEPTAEIAGIPASWVVQEIRKLEVPLLGAQRCAVILKRA
ncbi:MAG: 16S rRNA (guanine(527)-N(7))-methyltransferase RsmG [Burkholderiaceae bacterium]